MSDDDLAIIITTLSKTCQNAWCTCVREGHEGVWTESLCYDACVCVCVYVCVYVCVCVCVCVCPKVMQKQSRKVMERSGRAHGCEEGAS